VEEDVEEEWEIQTIILLYKEDHIFVLNIWWEVAEKTEPDFFRKCIVVGRKDTDTIFCKENSAQISGKCFFL